MPINVEAAIGDEATDADDGFQLAYGPNGARPRIDYTDEELGLFTLAQAEAYEDAHPITWIVDNLLCTGTINIIASEAKCGKMQPLDTPILTRYGWSTIGALTVGDEVHTADGSLTKVVAKSPVTHGQKCYRVTTKSGASTIAGADHLWEVMAHGNIKQIVTTEKLKDGHQGRRWTIPVPSPLCRDVVHLSIEPYLLGYWLGNGSSRRGAIWTNANDTEHVLSTITASGYECSAPIMERGCHRFNVHGLWGQLRKIGLDRNKVIPDDYLLGSVWQRRALLAGLLDSDGYAATAANGSGAVEFCSTRKELAEQTLMLARSLGIKARIAEGRAKLNGKDCGSKYRVTFAASKDDSPFSSPRKKNALPDRPLSPRSLRDAIVSVDELPAVPMQCIKVEHPSGLYVTDRSFMVTHNTTLLNTLTYAVSTGKADLVGRKITAPGHVVYYSLEARMRKCINLMKKNNASDAPVTLVHTLPDIWWGEGAAGAREHLCMTIERKKPILVIVDMMTHMFDIEDVKEYGEVSRTLIAVEKLLKAQYTDTCVIFSMHMRKPSNAFPNHIPGIADIHGSAAYGGRAHTNILLYRKGVEKDVRYIRSVGRDGEGDIEDPTAIGLCPDTGLVRLRTDLEQSTAFKKIPEAQRCLDTVEGNTERFVSAVKRYCELYKVRHVTLTDLWSWSGLNKKATKNAKVKAINDGMVAITSGAGVRGHSYTFAIAPGFTVPPNWLARPLPRDSGYTEKYEDETKRLAAMGIKRGSKALAHLAETLVAREPGDVAQEAEDGQEAEGDDE